MPLIVRVKISQLWPGPLSTQVDSPVLPPGLIVVPTHVTGVVSVGLIAPEEGLAPEVGPPTASGLETGCLVRSFAACVPTNGIVQKRPIPLMRKSAPSVVRAVNEEEFFFICLVVLRFP